MNNQKNSSNIANPAPLGLLGFSMTTCLLNLHNVGLISLTMVIVAMVFSLGGVAQIIAGFMAFKKNNTFGATAFTAYGFFWLSLLLIWTEPFSGVKEADSKSMGFYLLLWCIFSTFMFIGTLKHNIISQIVYGSRALLLLLQSIANFVNMKEIHIIAGYVGIFCGLSALYNAMGQIINHEFGKKVMPL